MKRSEHLRRNPRHLRTIIDGEKKPLNVMEVANLWFFLAISDNTVRNEEIAHNLAIDPELKNLLKDVNVNIHGPIVKEITDFLIQEKVPIPKGTPLKPAGDFPSIPEATKLNDEEIANLMSFNLLIGITYAARGVTESVRADVGLIFFKVIVKKVIFGASLKKLMAKRGWLREAPPFKP